MFLDVLHSLYTTEEHAKHASCIVPKSAIGTLLGHGLCSRVCLL